MTYPRSFNPSCAIQSKGFTSESFSEVKSSREIEISDAFFVDLSNNQYEPASFGPYEKIIQLLDPKSES